MNGQSPIEIWLATLTPEQFLEHQRLAGRRRWVRASISDRRQVAMRLQPFRLSKAVALARLEAANLAKAERQLERILSKRPLLR
jgi:hypothetical protein